MSMRVAVVAIASLWSVPVAPVPVDITTTSTVPAAITIEGASAAWTRRIDWSLERFRDAALALPPIVIRVHDDKEQCNGASGLFRLTDGVDEVHLCVEGAADSGVARLTTLHELAHAWAETELTATERQSFLTLRRLEVWADQHVPRHEWGAEHAAEVVSWGLMEEAGPIIRIHDTEPADLLTAYHELVGRAPLWS